MIIVHNYRSIPESRTFSEFAPLFIRQRSCNVCKLYAVIVMKCLSGAICKLGEGITKHAN